MSKKQYTGHKNIMMPDGKSLTEWILPIVKDECRFYGVEMLSEKQMAVVISALRMHHLMMHASQYDYSELGKPDEVQKYWPLQSSIGRYFRDAAQAVLIKD